MNFVTRTFSFFIVLGIVLLAGIYREGLAIEPEFLINTYISDEQSSPTATSNGSQYFIAWESFGQDGSGNGIYGKIISASGAGLTSELSINTDVTDDNQSFPATANNGLRYMTVWQSEGEDNDGHAITGSIIDNDGIQIAAPFQINTATINDQITPAICAMKQNFIVVWPDKSVNNTYQIKKSTWDMNGNSVDSETTISSITNIIDPPDHIEPAICANMHKYAVAWTVSGTGTDNIYINLFYDNDARLFTEEQQVSESLFGNRYPALSTDGSHFLVVWSNVSQDGDGYGIFGRLIDNDGVFGSEFQINSYTIGDQTHPSVCFNGSYYLVCWTSSLQDGSGDGVYGRLIAVNGSFIGEEFRIASHTEGNQGMPVCSSIGSDFMVFWEGNSNNTDNHGIYATQLISPLSDTDADLLANHEEWSQQTDYTNPDTDNDMLTDGSEVLEYHTNPLDNDSDNDSLKDGEEVFINPGETLVNVYTINGQSNVSAASSEHGYMLAWLSITPEDSLGIYGRLLDNDGTPIGGDIHVNTYTAGQQDTPAIGSNGDNYLVAWQSLNQDNDSFGIYAQLIGNDGQKIGQELRINSTTVSDQRDPAIASNGSTYLVLWQSYAQSGNDNYDIYGRIIDNEGTYVSPEMHINTYTTLEQRNPAVEFNGAHYLAVWESKNQDGDSFGIYAQLLDNDAQKIGIEFKVNSHTVSEQIEPAITSDGTNFLVVWSSLQQAPDTSGYGVFAQLIDNEGALIGPEININTYTTSNQRLSSVTHNGHEYLIVWESFGQDGSNKGIFGQRIANDLTFIGPEFRINNHTAGSQASPSVTSKGTDYLAAFHGEGVMNVSDIFVVRFKWAAGTDPLDNDTDNDSYCDGSEITAGTNPLDASSLFEIFALDVPKITVDASFSWFSVPGKKYTIYADSSNNSAGFVILGDHYASQGFITTYTDNGGGEYPLTHPSLEQKSRIYKVGISE